MNNHEHEIHTHGFNRLIKSKHGVVMRTKPKSVPAVDDTIMLYEIKQPPTAGAPVRRTGRVLAARVLAVSNNFNGSLAHVRLGV